MPRDQPRASLASSPREIMLDRATRHNVGDVVTADTTREASKKALSVARPAPGT
jgi:hypothetical protein